LNRSSGLVVGVALLAGLVLQASLHAAVSAPQTFLPGSVRPVDATPPTAADPHKPYISRRTLRADETAASLDIEVVLQMHNFDELQERAARGDRIPFSEMAAKYYPAAADYQKVVNWLVQRGFTIQQQDADHMAVFASARVDRLQTGLSLKFARVTQDGSEYTSAISSPAVPSELASVLVGINGLQPNIQMHTHSIIRPLYTDGPGALYGPGQIATAYDAAHLYSYSIKGSGQTIAIVINTYPLMSDLTAFWSAFAINRGTSTVTFIEAVTNAGTLAAPSGEETLDTEWSSSIAPGANVRVYATYDLKSAHLDRGYAKVYSDIQAGIPIHEMSMSYGGAEYYYVSEGDSSQLYTDDQYFAELAVAGVTNFASTGDVGATPSSTNGAGGATLTPETPSTDPNVTAVGGTALMADSSGNVSGEVVWNETSATQGSGATGGGTSYYFARPSWQTGATLPASSYRMVPDVASSADPTYGAYIILNGNYYDIGGTSWSSPTWAGFGALLNQARANAGQSALGILGPYLYPQIGTVNFRDITSGSNIYDSTLG
jgi:kumamolisin